jgi:hypothetical protein
VAEVHVTLAVRSRVERSEYTTVATQFWFAPGAMLGVLGVTAMDTRVAEVTVSVALPVRAAQTPATLQLAVMIAVPALTALPRPLALTVATAASEEVQARSVVRCWAELSENVPVAVKGWLVPAAVFSAGAINGD